MRIPEVRQEVLRIANVIKEIYPDEAKRLRQMEKQLHRRKPAKVTTRSISTPMTPDLVKQIKNYVAKHPKATQLAVAGAFKVHPGRVSEVIRGKRK